MPVHPLSVEDIAVLRRLAVAGGSITPELEAGRMWAIAYVLRLGLAKLQGRTLSLTPEGAKVAARIVRENIRWAITYDEPEFAQVD